MSLKASFLFDEDPQHAAHQRGQQYNGVDAHQVVDHDYGRFLSCAARKSHHGIEAAGAGGQIRAAHGERP